MSAPNRRFRLLQSCIALCCLALGAFACHERAAAINILIDYRYDEAAVAPFFNTQAKKDVLQAAASRFSNVITETLLAATMNGTNDARIGFTHPVTGASHEISSATGTGNDSIFAVGGGAASEYRGSWTIPADTWILYPGARPLATAAEGGTATGTNFETTFSNPSSHVNRGFRPGNTSTSANKLPVWGGSISFDNDGSTNWHFGLNTVAPNGTLDFYSIALHEIGHALGLSTNWIDWTSKQSGSQFLGTQSVATYNQDNGTSLSGLNQVSSSNRHWQDGAYDSYIFMNGSPNLTGTVGAGVKQDLIMEPTANFTASVKRFELTNVDVAALVDIGWSVLPQINVQPGDYNGDGTVNAADYVVWRKGLSSGDYNTWRANFGESLSGGGANGGGGSVPEPAALALLAVAGLAIACVRRR